MTTNPLNAIEWHPVEKILFRFFFCYSLLYLFPFPARYIPFLKFLSPWVDQFWQWLSLWTAENIFNITKELPLSGRGSGDTTLNYIRVFNHLVLAVGATVIWSVLDRKRTDYRTLFRYQIVYLRYFTAFILLSYGIVKIIPTQFWGFTLFDLIKPYGDSSPMGLMWKFMGYSDTYTRFSGVAEALGGIFLLFRRTERLGALIGFGVMLNVFLMNMSYDIPVKIFSFHLIFACSIILSTHIKGFLNFFILNKNALPEKIPPYSTRKKINITGYIFKGIFIIYFITQKVTNTYTNYTQRNDKTSLPALYGIYDVKDFVHNGDTISPSLTDTLRWKKLVVDRYSTGIIKMDDKITYLQNETDTLKHSLTLTSFRDSTFIYTFKYTVKDSIMYANGTHGKDPIQITLKKKDHNDFFLLNRGFHWINEFPFNR